MQRAFALQPAAAWRWSLLACLVFGAATPVQAAIPPAESQALVDLYNATGGASWTNRTNWITAVGAECTWFGVTCDGGQTHVVALQLSNNHLDGVLPDLQKGDALELQAMEPRQHFTQPPPRFTQASLIKELDEKGIGRPSTYAAIISNILDREYVSQNESRQLVPTDLGFLVNDLLVESFPDILNVEFTASMEDELDKIEDGKEKWTKAMKRFYTPFAKDLKKAEKEMRDVKRQEVPTDIACEKCGKLMVVKWGRNGEFIACPSYPECKNTKNFKRDDKGEIEIAVEEEVDEACEKCGKPMLLRFGKFGKFLGCSGYPECKNIQPLQKPVDLGIKCPECKEGNIKERKSRWGKMFYGCDKYPECKFATWDKPMPTPCPDCDSPILVEKVLKRTGRTHRCYKKECGYSIQVAEQ